MGSTRTVTLSKTYVPSGTTGVIVNVTTLDASAAGYLKVYPGNQGEPSLSTLRYQTSQIGSSMITVGVSASGEIKIYTSQSVNTIIDIIGTVA